MKYFFEKFAGQIIVRTEEGQSMTGFYVIDGKVTCTKDGDVCFGSYMQAPTQKEIEIVKNAIIWNGATEKMQKIVLAKMCVNMAAA